MSVSFPYKKERSPVLGLISRPYIQINFWSAKTHDWVEIEMILDSGADYTLLPKFYAEKLGVSLSQETVSMTTSGVGGSVKVYFSKAGLKIKLGEWERRIPVGFLNNNEVPPLFGRHNSMNTFKITLYQQVAIVGEEN